MRLSTVRPASVLLLLATGLGLTSVLAAQSLPPVVQINSSPLGQEWSEETYLEARPVRLRWHLAEDREAQLAGAGPIVDRPPRRPTKSAATWQKKQLVDPVRLVRRGGKLASRNLDPLSVTPHNRGTFRLDYTSSRLIPSEARLWYPYSTVGKLFMTDSSGDSFVCTGAVIAKRLVLTAGHCVHDGDGFLTDFRFVPAYHNGEAPIGSWGWTRVYTTGEWASGGGDIPNLADFGILVIRDMNGDRIGTQTGTLGWITNHLAPNHLTLLGYPANHDRGQQMHQVTSGSWDLEAMNNVVYGSDMGGGSSGGPWVQNFNVKAKGQKGGNNKARLRVVGATSWGFVSKKPRGQGSSTLNAAFVAMQRQACAADAGNC